MGDIDPVQLQVNARRQRRSFGRLSRLVSSSVRLVWTSTKRPFVALIGLQIIAALALAAMVLVVKQTLDAVLLLTAGETSGTALWLPVGLLAGLTGVSAITGALQGNLQRYVGENVSRTMWQRVLGVATSVSLRHFESPDFYDRLRRVQTSGMTRPYQVTKGLMSMAGALIASIGLAAAIVSLHPLLLPLLVLGGIPMLITSRKESRLEFDFAVQQTPSQRMRAYLTLIQTGRDEAKEIRAFDLAKPLGQRFDSTYETYIDDLRGHLKRRSAWNVAGNVGSAILLAVTLAVLVWLIADGQVGVAAAGAAIVAIRALAGQIQTLFGGVQQVFESGLFLEDLEKFMEVAADAEVEDAGAEADKELQELAVDRVSFSYPGSDAAALNDVSISLRRGEIVAIVGENGSGKTTLAKIIAGLYDPDAGTVRWNGVDSKTLRRASLRSRVAVIFQDFVRYALSAQENIALLGRDQHVDHARVRGAAEATGAASAIDSLPQGYKTPLSKMFSGGQDLSGGQWQRIALARAYYRDAPLVVLDEPTAALDPRAEHDLFASLRHVLEGRTALFISHRFSTVRTADRIYVMEAGRIVEGGTHDELMSKDGHYAELFRLQAAAYLAPHLPSSDF